MRGLGGPACGDRYAGARSTPGHQPHQAQGNVLEGGGAGQWTIGVGLEGGDAPGHQVAAEATATVERNAVTATRELIDTLVECATPVRRLRPPLVRAQSPHQDRKSTRLNSSY